MQRGKMHPAPWKIDGWGTKDGARFRVLDALNNPITQPNADRSEVQRIIDARNEDLSLQIQDMLDTHQREIDALNELHFETHKRWITQIEHLETLVRSLNYPE